MENFIINPISVSNINQFAFSDKSEGEVKTTYFRFGEKVLILEMDKRFDSAYATVLKLSDNAAQFVTKDYISEKDCYLMTKDNSIRVNPTKLASIMAQLAIEA